MRQRFGSLIPFCRTRQPCCPSGLLVRAAGGAQWDGWMGRAVVTGCAEVSSAFEPGGPGLLRSGSRARDGEDPGFFLVGWWRPFREGRLTGKNEGAHKTPSGRSRYAGGPGSGRPADQLPGSCSASLNRLKGAEPSALLFASA